MRSAIAALALLLSPPIIFCQDHGAAPGHQVDASARDSEQQFNFPGGASLKIGRDSMTDAKTCVAFTSNSGAASIIVAGGTVAEISTYGDADYNSPALLRVDSGQPIRLLVPHRPNVLMIPLQKSPEVIRALYAQRHLQLRFVKYPSGVVDDEIEIGDFAAAYDRAIDLCGWPKMKIAAVHPAPQAEPKEDAPQLDPLEPYVAAVARVLTTNWLGLRGENKSGRAVLAFAIDKAGSVGTMPAARSDEDRGCVNAVRASIPFPPLPAAREQQLAVRVECAGDAVKVFRLD